MINLNILLNLMKNFKSFMDNLKQVQFHKLMNFVVLTTKINKHQTITKNY